MSSTNSVYRRTIIGVALFGLFGLFAVTMLIHDWTAALPLVLTYAVLVYDTFFSLRYFTAITPTMDRTQKLFDYALILSYGAIALNLNNPLGFMASMSVMFLIASGKYIFLRKKIGPSEIIFRKIRIDIFGAIGYGLCTVPIFFGWIWQASWALFIGYVLANVQILWHHPLYPYNRPDSKTGPQS